MTTVTVVAAVAGAVLFTGTAGASPVSAAAATPSPSASPTLTNKPVPTTSPSPTGDPTASASPTLTNKPVPTTSPTASPTLTNKPVPTTSPTAGGEYEITVFGVAEDGAQPGCTVLRTYYGQRFLLLLPHATTWSAWQFRRAIPKGVPLQVTGLTGARLASYCFEDNMVQVQQFDTF